MHVISTSLSLYHIFVLQCKYGQLRSGLLKVNACLQQNASDSILR